MRNAWNLMGRLVKPAVSVRGVPAALAMMSLVSLGFGFAGATAVVAKTPGKTYCFYGVCHRVLTLAETRARVGKRASAIASYYDDCRRDRFNPCGLTSSGAVFRPGAADNAASPIYPNGTKLLVFNPSNGKAAVVRIDNAGPYWGRRTLDLSRAAAEKLGFRASGVARLVVQVVKAPSAREARYKRRRRYQPVKGYLGEFDDVGEALAAAGYAARVMTALMGADPSWSPDAARATPVLPVRVAMAPAPLPERPTPQFTREIRRLAVAERRQREAVERKRRAAERRLALAEAKAKAKAEADAAERRRVAQAAAREKQKQNAAARKAIAAKSTPASSQQAVAAAQSAAKAAPQSPSASSSASAATGEPAPAPRRSRTVWRREVISIPQNAS